MLLLRVGLGVVVGEGGRVVVGEEAGEGGGGEGAAVANVCEREEILEDHGTPCCMMSALHRIRPTKYTKRNRQKF